MTLTYHRKFEHLQFFVVVLNMQSYVYAACARGRVISKLNHGYIIVHLIRRVYFVI